MERLTVAMDGCGAVAWGVSEADYISQADADAYDQWIAMSHHADMHYMERHAPLRQHPRSVLPSAASVISAAFAYPLSRTRSGIASYALGQDYHKVLRRRLQPVVRMLKDRFSAEARICVDSAPVAERVRALNARLGYIGRNRLLIVPGVGSRVLLAEIVTSLPLPRRWPPHINDSCGDCRRCIDACPGHALDDTTPAGFDSRRCLSYLTIECRSPLVPGSVPSGVMFGCDVCQRVCPKNTDAPVSLPEFEPNPAIATLTPKEILEMSQDDFDRMSQGSPVRRAGLEGLKRNITSWI